MLICCFDFFCDSVELLSLCLCFGRTTVLVASVALGSYKLQHTLWNKFKSFLFFSLQAHLNFCNPVLCSWSAVGTQDVISFGGLELKEAALFRLFGGARSGQALRDSLNLWEVNVASTLEVLACVVVSKLVLGWVENEPALLPTFDSEIGLQK